MHVFTVLQLPAVSEQNMSLEMTELKRALHLYRQGTLSPMRTVEKELEGKKCNILKASGPAGKITIPEWSCLFLISRD